MSVLCSFMAGKGEGLPCCFQVEAEVHVPCLASIDTQDKSFLLFLGEGENSGSLQYLHWLPWLRGVRVPPYLSPSGLPSDHEVGGLTNTGLW